MMPQLLPGNRREIDFSSGAAVGPAGLVLTWGVGRVQFDRRR